ncbi:TolC family protein [Zoogloea sp.]|uniref:TolC family protein n=1 Tax=Zoogloea sp. TaxID=49181 RepID=UPI0035AF0F63
MRRLVRFAALLAAIAATSAHAFDPLGSQRDLAGLAPPGLLPLDAELVGGPACPGPLPAALPDGRISLAETIKRALCQDPRTRQAWAESQIQAARLGASRADYLPTINATLSQAKVGQTVSQAGLSARSDSTTRLSQLNMAWNLFDFGQREANVESARQTLLAAVASQNLGVQTVFVDAANAYFALLSAQGELAVAREVERINLQSFMAAEAKHAAGIGDLTSKLQTQTAFAQAILARVRAEGTLANAQGRLAVAIGESPQRRLAVDADDARLPDTDFVRNVGEMLETAQQVHPELGAARARLAAARARIGAAERANLPSISLAASRGHTGRDFNSDQPDIAQRDRSVALQLNVPVFDGFSRLYQTRAARAEFELAEADLKSVEQKVALEVWQAWQSLQTETQALDSTEKLLAYATKSLEVAQGRFKAGVGSTLELLEAQRAMADAAQQRINALANWRATRLRLAASLGRIGFWSVRGQ